MRIVFAGTPEFACPSLERLIESGHEVAAVVTQPDKPSGRGRKIVFSPIKEAAIKHGIPVLQPERLRKPPFVEVLRPYNPEIMIVAAYGKILPQDILDLPRLGCVNIHASLLPKYRGAAPINRAIMNGEKETGITLMKMDATMDTGDILITERIPILDDDDALSVTNMLSVIGADMLIRYLDDLGREGEVKGTPQDHAAATYAPAIEKVDCRVDWSADYERILCHIRGLAPEPGAYTWLDDRIIKILRAEPLFGMDKEYEEVGRHEEIEPGTVIHTIKGQGPLVKVNGGLIVLHKLKPEGKAVMSGQDFVNGGFVKKGDRFGWAMNN